MIFFLFFSPPPHHFSNGPSLMQIIVKLYVVQEVPGNVGNRKGVHVNGKYYFSIYEINTGYTVFFVCLKYDVFSPVLYEKN